MPFEPVLHPAPGCIVEFLQGNGVECACVLEAASGRLRLILANRRETAVPLSRILPWAGPQLAAPASKDAAVGLIALHAERRAELAKTLDPAGWWELAQGEMSCARAEWFAELTDGDIDADLVAACGHLLLADKTHFRFRPPEFTILDAATVEKRRTEQEQAALRERTAKQGTALMHALWEGYLRHSPPPAPQALSAIDPDVIEDLKDTLRALIADPDRQASPLWKLVSKGLPDEPELPLRLAQAWGLVGPHHNPWFERAGYDPDDAWALPFTEDVAAIREASGAAALPLCDLPFISIDNATTRDIDDAFFISRTKDGWRLTLALACPALVWPFGSDFDTAVLNRATSVYLPEATCHMLPKSLATDALSLPADAPRPALTVALAIREDGTVDSCTPSLARVRVTANLTYADAEAALDGASNPASSRVNLLREALRLAKARQTRRIADGAVIISRPELSITIAGDIADANVNVILAPEEDAPRAHLIVAEQMVAANGALAAWAHAAGIPLIFRGQEVRTAENLSGIWTDPVLMVPVVRQMGPAVMDTVPRRHAGVGEDAYAPVTSPLRRYADLFNEAQIVRALTHRPPAERPAAEALLTHLGTRLDAVGRLQRLRTRYWKSVYLLRHAEERWDGIVTDINPASVAITLIREQVLVRGSRSRFPSLRVGMPVTVKLGRIDPLSGETTLLDVQQKEPA